MLSGKLFAVDSVDFAMMESELGSRQAPVVRSKWSNPLSHSTQEMSRLAAVLIKKSTYFHRAAGSVLVGEASYSPKRRGTLGKALRSRWKSDFTVVLSLSEPQIVFPQALKIKSSRSQPPSQFNSTPCMHSCMTHRDCSSGTE